MLTKENLIHTVTKITVLKENDECKIGTGFFYKYHVIEVEEDSTGKLYFHTLLKLMFTGTFQPTHIL